MSVEISQIWEVRVQISPPYTCRECKMEFKYPSPKLKKGLPEKAWFYNNILPNKQWQHFTMEQFSIMYL